MVSREEVITMSDTIAKKCIGCGVKKQTENIDEVGYVKQFEHQLCVRCHEIKNFNKLPTVNLENEEFEKILYNVGQSGNLVVWILDIFDLQGSYLEKVESYLSNNKVILVANKTDLIPKAVSPRKQRQWFIDSIDADINVVDVLLTSAKSKKNVDDLIGMIKHYTKEDVYFIGATNTGKSSLINAIIKSQTPNSQRQVTTSPYAGTTLSTINIPLTKKMKIIDTPGIMNAHQVTNYLSKESIAIVTPQVEVRPTNFQLNPEQTLFVTGLFRVDFVNGEKSSFTVYASKKINVHRTKLEKADVLFGTHFGREMLAPPFSDVDNISKDDFVTTTIWIKPGKTDLILSGLGWISIKTESDLKLEVSHIENVLVTTRKAMI